MRAIIITILAIVLSASIANTTEAQKRTTPTSSKSVKSRNVQVKTKKITKKTGRYIEKYAVMASDTSKRHGTYELVYKEKVIEKGQYKKGERAGEWTFYNIHNEVEFKYDYDQNLPFNILPHKGYVYNEKTFPCMYLGSPLVPYHFITERTYYPVKESENTTDCSVVLALEISATGKVTGYHLERKSREEFNRVVLEAASKIPQEWRFVPARNGGKNVASIYCISLIFEAVE